MNQSAQQIWQAALERIQSQLAQPVFETWFGGSKAISLENNTLTIQATSPFTQCQLERRYTEIISEAVGKDIIVQFCEWRSSGKPKLGASHRSTSEFVCPHCGNIIAK